MIDSSSSNPSLCEECLLSLSAGFMKLERDEELLAEVEALSQKLRTLLQGVDATCIRLDVKKQGLELGIHKWKDGIDPVERSKRKQPRKGS